MRKILTRTFAAFALLISTGLSSWAQVSPAPTLQFNPWTSAQLMQPAQLASMIKKGKKVRIYNIGVVDDIPGAINMGAASEKENLAKFSQVVKTLPKSELIVVYCGCCPFDRCPNIRPAFTLLKAQKFSKAMLLNLPTNLRTDWVSKGYPLKSSTK
ncbi:rhodanese-like domain-containing protein [Albibacterium bauzanense]|uniref:Rhodanese-like domain-containing protein n=1 Tax=Albibacterium bauzanense TaxID=653929 RepID=A0A4V2PXV7_9SPHI|nr:rhodanese-like domain-containing protein [Albibacterium bauzanense]TCK83631.1 hypothetical protein C8N28_2236 [Albibacterium bauzanense]